MSHREEGGRDRGGREERGGRRSRSRSRDRRDDKGDRDRNDRDRAERDRETRTERERVDTTRDRDTNRDANREGTRGREGGREGDRDRLGDREGARGEARGERGERPKEKKLTRSEIEALKKERVALVKRLTQGDESDEEGKGNKDGGEADDGLGDVDNNAEDIAKLLGFGGFGTTKGKQVIDNKEGASSGAVSKHKERKYRQYMNRKAGFNRPLQAMP